MWKDEGNSMSTIQIKWEQESENMMKYETPMMEMLILEENDIITLSTGKEGSGTILNPFAPKATSVDWE